MKSARIESFRREKGGVIVLVDHSHGSLNDYEFDHLGDVVCSYLSVIGFDSIVGPASVRTHLSDEELEQELDDFEVVANTGSEEDDLSAHENEEDEGD